MNPTIDRFLSIVKKQNPNTKTEDIQFFDNGKDHYVFVVNNIYAYRFPRGEGFGKKDTIENKFFRDFAKTSPVKVQEMEEHNDENIVYQTYQFINGVGFTKEVAQTFNKDELKTVALKLGAFLKQLHLYPLEKAHAISMDSVNSAHDYLSFFGDRLKTVQKNVFPLLPQEAQVWIEKLFKVYLETSKELFTIKVTHFDMQPVHIIVDTHTHTLSGVIDFSLRIADPARDFMYLNRYGNDFLQAAYDSYGEKDAYFDVRRQFYAGEFELLELESALVGKNEASIERARLKLLEYIKEYPVI